MIGLLEVVNGVDGDRGRSAAFGAAAVSIGRGPEAGLRLQDPSVSRIHCKVVVVAGKATLTDAGSSTGTLINGAPQQQHELQEGDVIHIGSTELQFHWSDVDEKSTATWHGPMPTS